MYNARRPQTAIELPPPPPPPNTSTPVAFHRNYQFTSAAAGRGTLPSRATAALPRTAVLLLPMLPLLHGVAARPCRCDLGPLDVRRRLSRPPLRAWHGRVRPVSVFFPDDNDYGASTWLFLFSNERGQSFYRVKKLKKKNRPLRSPTTHPPRRTLVLIVG